MVSRPSHQPLRYRNAHRIKESDKIIAKQLNYDGIEFLVTVKPINKIGKQNDIRVNVFGYENKQKFPIHISKEKFEKTLNLLLIKEGDKEHYVPIKDFDRFMRNQTKLHHTKHFCMYCIRCFTSEAVLNKQKETCIVINGAQAIKCGKRTNQLNFKIITSNCKYPL